jgi:putative ABC transport system permease protein
MEFIEVLKLAIMATWAHKLRSALTLLGIVIGITAVVIVVSLIEGFNSYVDEKIARIGTKSFTVSRFAPDDYRDTDTYIAAQKRNQKLTIEEFEFLRRHSGSIDQIGAKASPTWTQVKYSTRTLKSVAVDGAMAILTDIENVDVSEGRYFTEAENTAGKRVAFLGSSVANALDPNVSMTGRDIDIAGLPYRVLGIATAKGTVFGESQDWFITVPLKTYSKDFSYRVRERGLYFVATAKSDELFNDAVDETRQLLRLRRGLAADENDNFGVQTPDGIASLRDRIFGPIFIVAIVVPSIALLVGGIVIMNIMLVSVTERTKEIGIRRALGARHRDILKQFLVEAVTLSSIGGVIGVIIAWLAGRLITALFFQTYLSIPAIVIAITVAGTVGILSGMLPAWKAARLDPIESLRAD